MSEHEPAGVVRYAGFWLRVAAWLIDGVLLYGGFWLVALLIWPELIERQTVVMETEAGTDSMSSIGLSTHGAIVLGVVTWAYTALMDSAERQGTLGKWAVRIKVTDLAGRRVSLLRASLRAWPLWLPNLLGVIELLGGLLGLVALGACIAVAFSRRKQGLHDKMAFCLLVRRAARPAAA